MVVCNGDVCKSISHMMMNDRESTHRTIANCGCEDQKSKATIAKNNNKPFEWWTSSSRQSTDETTHKNNGMKYDKECN